MNEEQVFSLFSLHYQIPASFPPERGPMEGTNTAHSAFCSEWQGSLTAVEGHSDSWDNATAACKSSKMLPWTTKFPPGLAFFGEGD